MSWTRAFHPPTSQGTIDHRWRHECTCWSVSLGIGDPGMCRHTWPPGRSSCLLVKSWANTQQPVQGSQLLALPYHRRHGKTVTMSRGNPPGGFPGGTRGKESACQCRRCRFNPWIRKIPWSRKWQRTPVFHGWKFHGQRGLTATVHGVANSQIWLSDSTTTKDICTSSQITWQRKEFEFHSKCSGKSSVLLIRKIKLWLVCTE